MRTCFNTRMITCFIGIIEFEVSTAHSNDEFCVGIKIPFQQNVFKWNFLSRRETRHLHAQSNSKLAYCLKLHILLVS